MWLERDNSLDNLKTSRLRIRIRSQVVNLRGGVYLPLLLDKRVTERSFSCKFRLT